jgi:hypothetical protein
MTRRDQVLSLLSRAAEALKPELPGLVFVGGAVVALYETPRAVDIRATEDVDCIVDALLPEYYALIERLKRTGFKQALGQDDPICRLHLAPDLTLDVMPVDPNVLGFSNRWYAEGTKAAREYQLPGGHTVRAITPIYFIATKFEAFWGRGKGDYIISHDIEDIVAVLRAQPELLLELEHSNTDVGKYVREQLARLGKDEDFLAALPGCLPPDAESQAQAAPLTEALQRLAFTHK